MKALIFFILDPSVIKWDKKDIPLNFDHIVSIACNIIAVRNTFSLSSLVAERVGGTGLKKEFWKN
jgi:hypothetical protein